MVLVNFRPVRPPTAEAGVTTFGFVLHLRRIYSLALRPVQSLITIPMRGGPQHEN